MGNALAAEFRRDGNGAKSEEYKTLMTNPERGAFRKKWLAAHIETLKEKRTRSRVWRTVDRRRGRMLNFTRPLCVECIYTLRL